MTLQRNFSNSITLAYKNSKKTLASFSDELGISRTTLQDILNGNSNPRVDTIEMVAEGLGVNPLSLLSTTYSEEDISLLLPLLRLGNIASSLSDDEKEDLASHCHAIIRILIGPDNKDK